jgi:REP element-mobilizing transposase RayT
MPDHLHVFVSAGEVKSLSRWMKALKGVLSNQLKALGEKPPFWQQGFFDHVLRSGESYSEKWEYVRRNPVRAGLVEDPDDWEYGGSICDLWW